MEPSATQVQELFDRVAPVYDRVNDATSFGLHRVWKRMAVLWSGAKAGDRALDLCCGSGDLAQLLGDRTGKTGRVWGVDFSAELLAVARSRPVRSPIEWVRADALNLPFTDCSFDAATMGYGLRNLTDIPRGLSELYRVLKPGATAAILDFNRPRSQWVRGFQKTYLDRVVVPQARSQGLEAEYAYIFPSLERFPDGKTQVQLSRDAGFSRAVHYPIALGLMGVLVVSK